jgi:hypothetical protein
MLGDQLLAVKTLPGEQAQVDWAYFGDRPVGGGG